MKHQMTPILLQKYVDGTCTEEETRMVEEWYHSLTMQEDHKLLSWDKAAVFNRVKQQINAEEDKATTPVFRLRKIFSITAAAAAVVLLAVGINLFTQAKTETSQSVLTGNNTPVPFADITRFTNNTSGIEKKMLPDGSTVWLNPGSSIEYFKKHRDSAREVNFSGEAFFDIAKDKEHPFVIYTGELRTKVVGTSFNIQAFPNSRTIKVSVVTGKVEVSHQTTQKKDAAILLVPNQQASYVVATKALSLQALTVENVRKEFWQPVTLSFTDATVKEVAAALEKAFEINIRLSNPDLSNCLLRVDFNNQKLPQIMDMLEKMLDVQCELKDEDLLITGQGCAR